jgi:4-amino-4-deoxy-L-arabinose transferase-like glycosyltransferase
MRLIAAGLLLGCAVVYLVGNGRMALFDRDEGWYAEISRTMVQSGDWVVPRFRNEVFNGKPVFAYWCQAVSMKLLGPTAAAARFPAVVFSLATLALVGWVVARIAGPRRALWTMFVLGSSALFMALAKLALTDVELLLWITLAQICLAALYFGKTSIWISILFWIAVALALLTKGPVVIGMLAANVIALMLMDVGRNFRSASAWLGAVRWWLETRPWLALLIVPAIVGPWVYLIAMRAPDFLRASLGQYMIGPIFHKPLNSRPNIPGVYLLFIWPMFLPWCILLPLALIKGWANRRLAAVRFALAAVIGPFILMELVKQKLPHYLLPIFPALAFLTADCIVRCLRGQYDPTRQRGWSLGVMIWSIPIALVGAALWLLTLPRFQIHGLPYAAMAAITLITFCPCTVLAWLLIRRRLETGFLLMGVGSMGLAIIITGFLVPSVEPLQGSRLVSDALEQAGFRRGERVAMVGYTEPSLTFYLDGSGTPTPIDFLTTYPPGAWPKWIVMSGNVWNNLPPEQRRRLDYLSVFGSLSMGSTNGTGSIVVLRKNNSDRDPAPGAVSER